MLHDGADSYKLLRRDNILDVYKAAEFLQTEGKDGNWYLNCLYILPRTINMLSVIKYK